jgi:putative RNA 2'-phosphotransferase
MSKDDLQSTSKFLSLVLRHRPEVVGMSLDGNGWLPINELIENANRIGKQLSLQQIHQVVATSAKKRFSLSNDGLQIRANQGHSVSGIDLQFEPATPPPKLYHGTVFPFLQSIRQQGLKKRSRHHVHLSANIETATQVGSRRGKPVILEVKANEMHAAGFAFYISVNGVWLTDFVPVEFLVIPNQ